MRFRLNANQHAQDSFGKGFANIFDAPVMEAQAAGEAQNDDMKRQALGAQIAAHIAQAAHSNAQADLTRTESNAIGSAPDVLGTVIASRAGVDVPTLNAWRSQMTTGRAPTATIPGDPTAEAPMADGQVQLPGLDPQIMARIGTEYGRYAPALINPTKYKVDDQAQASGMYQKQDLLDQVLAGQRQPADVGQATAALDGKPLVDNVGNTGRSFNRFTGAGGTIDPGLSALFDQGELAQVGQRNAAAGASNASAVHSYASAGQARAAADKLREETGQIKTAPKGQLVQTADGPVFADPRTGASVPVLNADGTPAAPKLKDIPAAQNHAFIENAKAIQNIQSAMDAIKKATGITLDADGNPTRDASAKPTSPDALGARNYLGDGIRQRTDPAGVSVRAQVANIGGQKYHDISGSAVTAGEAKRLEPFIPHSTDGPGVALQKLSNLLREYQSVNDMYQQTYSRDLGFKSSAGARPAAPAGPKVTNW